jgi:hypothetical protein
MPKNPDLALFSAFESLREKCKGVESPFIRDAVTNMCTMHSLYVNRSEQVQDWKETIEEDKALGRTDPLRSVNPVVENMKARFLYSTGTLEEKVKEFIGPLSGRLREVLELVRTEPENERVLQGLIQAITSCRTFEMEMQTDYFPSSHASEMQVIEGDEEEEVYMVDEDGHEVLLYYTTKRVNA